MCDDHDYERDHGVKIPSLGTAWLLVRCRIVAWLDWLGGVWVTTVL